MTAPAVELPATTAYRVAQNAAMVRAWRDLLALWPLLDQERPETLDPFVRAALTLVARHRADTATAASGYLRTVAAASGARALVLPDPGPNPRAAVTSLRITSWVGYRVARRAGQTPELAARTALMRTGGVATRLVADGGRDTVRASVAADPAAQGWRRATRAGACSFCRTLADRGGVYKADTVAFRSHDHCGCTAEPVYRA